MQACDEYDKRFLIKKYGFERSDFMAVQKLFNKGFSTMKASKIVAERNSEANAGNDASAERR